MSAEPAGSAAGDRQRLSNANPTWSGWHVRNTAEPGRGAMHLGRNETRTPEGWTGRFPTSGLCSMQCRIGSGRRGWSMGRFTADPRKIWPSDAPSGPSTVRGLSNSGAKGAAFGPLQKTPGVGPLPERWWNVPKYRSEDLEQGCPAVAAWLSGPAQCLPGDRRAIFSYLRQLKMLMAVHPKLY